MSISTDRTRFVASQISEIDELDKKKEITEGFRARHLGFGQFLTKVAEHVANIYKEEVLPNELLDYLKTQYPTYKIDEISTKVSFEVGVKLSVMRQPTSVSQDKLKIKSTILNLLTPFFACVLCILFILVPKPLAVSFYLNRLLAIGVTIFGGMTLMELISIIQKK